MVPNIPYLPKSPQSPRQWFDWAEQVLIHRFTVTWETTENTSVVARDKARAREIQRCKESDLYCIATYGTIYEARPNENDEGDMSSAFYINFIPYPFQISLIDEFNQCLKRKGSLGDLLCLKSRDMGASNCVCFWVAVNWMTRRPFSIRMLSRREDLVDAIGDPDSLFWKIETFLKALPTWLVQGLMPGFDWKKHRGPMRFVNPVNANLISGESTNKNAGRGGRATAIIYDEMAFMPNLGAIWTAGRASTRHRIGLSTASIEEGLEFHNMWMAKDGYDSPTKIRLDWNLHPRHDEFWLAEERSRDSEAGIQREIFMNFFAGDTDTVYPEAQEKHEGDYPFIPGAGPVYVTIDDGFDDDFAICWIQYINATGRMRVFQSYRNSHKVTGFYGSLLKGVPEQEFGMFYGPEERRIMGRQLELPPAIYTGDPHMTHTEQLTGTSPMEYLLEKYGINAFTQMKSFTFKERRLALGALLPLIDFNAEDGGYDVLEALQRYRFKTVKDGKDQMTEYKQPLHDRYSHFVTALEWLAVNWQYIRISSSYDSINWVGKPAA